MLPTSTTPRLIHRGGKTITADIRVRLINAHQDGVSYKRMENLFGVKKDTAYRICSSRQFITKSRGDTKGKKIDDLSAKFLVSKVENRPDITLSELKDVLHEARGLSVSISIIARCLEGQLISMKKLELIPANRNSEQVNIAKREHALWLQSQHENGATFCYVDECGFGKYTARTRGRSVIRLPARRVTDSQRTPHITMLCAISPTLGLIHSQTMIGGAKQRDFDDFITTLFDINFGPASEGSGNIVNR